VRRHEVLAQWSHVKLLSPFMAEYLDRQLQRPNSRSKLNLENGDIVEHSNGLGSSTAYTPKQGRKFGLTVGIAFMVFGGIAFWRGHPRVFMVLAALGTTLVLAALLVPTALRATDAAWMRLALVISRVTTPLLMGVIYFVVLTPVGFVRRRFGGNPLVHRAGVHGLWGDRSATPKSSLDRLF
jgi:hypothetical protein